MRERRPLRDTVGLAGWLFADLLLGLSMVFLVSNTVAPPIPTPTPTATPTATPTPLPSATATVIGTATWTATPPPPPTATPTATEPPPVVLDQKPFSVTLRTDRTALFGTDAPSRQAEQSRLIQEIQRTFAEFVNKRRAGIVLTFGTAKTPREGGQLAGEINRLLVEALPEVFIAGADGTVFRDFHFIDPDPARQGNAEIEVYFLSGE